MTIQVYPYNEQEEKALLKFLKSRHYHYKSTDENEPDAAFLEQYNKELNEAESQIDSGNYMAHEEVKKYFANKSFIQKAKKALGKNVMSMRAGVKA